MILTLKLILLLSPALLAIGGLIALYYFKSLRPGFKLIAIFLWINLCVDLLGHISDQLFAFNLWLIPVMAFLELFVLSILYHRVLFSEKKILLRALSIVGCVFLLWHSVSTIFSPGEAVANTRIVSTTIITVMGLYFCYDRIKGEPNNQYFITNGAILIYYSMSTILFIPVDFLIYEPTLIKFYFWMANFVFTLAFYITLTLRLWKHGRHQQLSQSG